MNELNIPYMLSGSVAMSLYVIPRATRDFDFVIRLLPGDIISFVENFRVGYYCDQDAIEDAVKRHSMFNLIDHDSGFKADFVILKESPFRLEEFNRRIKMDYFGKTIYVVSPEDLLISKLIWIQDIKSGLQMEDIKNLNNIDSLDWTYIRHWVQTLKLNTFELIKK